VADLVPQDVGTTSLYVTEAPPNSVKLHQTFTPLDWQIAPWQDRSLVLLLTGAAGGGKSQLAGEKIHALAMKYPGSTSLIVRKARESMTNGTVPFFSTVIIGDDPRVRILPSKHRWEYANGSVVVWGGMYDAKQREAIRSIGVRGGVDFVWMEEATAFTEEDFNEILMRMRGNMAGWTQVILTTNPDRPTHWIYRRLIKGREAKTFYSRAADNKYNPASYAQHQAKLTGAQYLRLVKGRWVQAEGVVYSQWDPGNRGGHVIRRFAIPEDWRRIRAIDFGFTNPFVCLWIAIDHDGRMYVYREIYRTQRLVEDHARTINALTGVERIEATIADHDAEGRATLNKYGIETVAAYKDIERGIEALKARMLRQPDGLPRIFWFEDALVDPDEALIEAKKPYSGLQEFESYRMPPKSKNNTEKELPINEDNHAMDALRYGGAYVDGLKIRGNPRGIILAAGQAPHRNKDVIDALTPDW